MKIISLQILDKAAYVGGDQGKADNRTHDIERTEGGYLLRVKRTGEVYFIDGSLAVAKLEPEPDPAAVTEEEADDAGDEPPARRPAGRGGRPKASPPPVQD